MDSIAQHLAALDPAATASAALAMFIAGWLWVSYPLFGRAYIRLSGIRPGDIRPEYLRVTGAVRFVTCIIAATLLSIIYIHTDHAREILYSCVAFIWAFIMLSQLNGSLTRREPFALFLLHTTRSLASLASAAAVLTLWS